MRLLFSMDMTSGNQNPNATAIVRPSARCITIRGNTLAMIHSLKYDYYKFPGGGVEKGETHEEAVIRETL